MRTRLALPLVRSSGVSLAWRVPAVLAGLSLGSLGSALAALVHYSRGEARSSLQLVAGVLLLGVAFVWGRFATREWLRPQRSPRSAWPLGRWAGNGVLGSVVVYLLALGVGPNPGTAYLFAACLLAWGAGNWFAFGARPEVIRRWQSILRRRGVRMIKRSACGGLALLAVAEVSLRGAEWIWGPTLLEPPTTFSVAWLHDRTGDSSAAGHAVHNVGMSSSKVESGADGSLVNGPRLGVMGNAVPGLRGSQGSAGQGAEFLPSLEVFSMTAPAAHPREYARTGIRQASELRPDALLLFVSVADDIVGEPQRPDLFDWHGLALARLLQRFGCECGGNVSTVATPAQPVAAARDRVDAGAWEGFVAACGPQLAVCRKPTGSVVLQRWKATFAHLDELTDQCRRESIPLALVVVPSTLQTNRPLLEAVCQRQGCGPSQLDIELPQRRMAAYAAERKLPMLDLLPTLRLCGQQPYAHNSFEWSPRGQEAAAQAVGAWLQSTFGATLWAHRPDRTPALASGGIPLLVVRQQ